MSFQTHFVSREVPVIYQTTGISLEVQFVCHLFTGVQLGKVQLSPFPHLHLRKESANTARRCYLLCWPTPRLNGILLDG